MCACVCFCFRIVLNADVCLRTLVYFCNSIVCACCKFYLNKINLYLNKIKLLNFYANAFRSKMSHVKTHKTQNIQCNMANHELDFPKE